MITIENKFVYSTLEELVDAGHVAVVVVDMQNDFCKPGWAFDHQGIDLSMYPPMIPRLARLATGAREAGALVIYIQMTMLPGRRSESPAQIRFNMRLHLASHQESEPLLYTIDGTAGQENYPEPAPPPKDFFLRTTPLNGFCGTNLTTFFEANLYPPAIM